MGLKIAPSTYVLGHGGSKTKPRQSLAKASGKDEHDSDDVHHTHSSCTAHSPQLLWSVQLGTAENSKNDKAIDINVLHWVHYSRKTNLDTFPWKTTIDRKLNHQTAP